MRVADLIFHRLKSEVDVVFYLPGGMCATLVDALGQSGIKADPVRTNRGPDTPRSLMPSITDLE